jgi:uncharacterized protein (TIGR02217 family)
MPLPSFHEVLFPEDISYGSSGGPAFNTTVIELTSGAEQRNINWSEVKANYDVSHGVKTREQMEDLQDFFYARRGKAYGFRFKDWADYTIEDQIIGIGNGTVQSHQAKKTYEPDSGYQYDRIIRKLVPGSVTISINNVVQPAHTVLVYNDTGLIRPTSPVPVGQIIRIVSAEFHVPVRFDIDEMKVQHDDFELMSWPSIPLVELKLR